MNQESKSKTWNVAWLSAAAIIIAAIIGLGMPFAENIAARYLPPFTPTVKPTQTTTMTVSPQPINQPTTVPNIQLVPPISRCDWLSKNFPQSKEDNALKFGLSVDRINLLNEACGSTATGLVVTLGTEVELQVYEDGGCIDAPSDASFSGNHVPNPYASGERAYSGAVRATVMTYRMWCDELH